MPGKNLNNNIWTNFVQKKPREIVERYNFNLLGEPIALFFGLH